MQQGQSACAVLTAVAVGVVPPCVAWRGGLALAAVAVLACEPAQQYGMGQRGTSVDGAPGLKRAARFGFDGAC